MRNQKFPGGSEHRTPNTEYRKPRLPALSRNAGQSGRYTGNGTCTANATACEFTSI
jgi:hypothetical protein